MDLLTTARRIESKIARTLDGVARRATGATPRDPLAIIHAVVEIVERELQPAGRGRRVFPFNSVTVTLAASSPAERARYEAVLDATPTLRERIVNGLRSTGADVADLDVRIEYTHEPGAHWTAAEFYVDLARLAAPAEVITVEQAETPAIELTIVHGSTEQPAYSLALARIDLGRGREVRNTRNHLLRTNHIAFSEGSADPVNSSVSRRHAHIVSDPASREYRIYDDGSAHGTHVLRNGSTIVVRAGSRGTRLRDDDEIVLGEARLRVRLPEV